MRHSALTCCLKDDLIQKNAYLAIAIFNARTPVAPRINLFSTCFLSLTCHAHAQAHEFLRKAIDTDANPLDSFVTLFDVMLNVHNQCFTRGYDLGCSRPIE